MKYRNTKTGALIETACPVSGGNWVEVKSDKPGKKTGMKAENANNKTETDKDDAQ